MAMFLCSMGGKSEVKNIANFDFTSSLTDSVNGFMASIYNCSRDSNGVYLNSANSFINIPDLTPINKAQIFTIEIDVGSCDFISSNHGRFFMWRDDLGFIYRNTGHWNVYNTTWNDEGSTDKNAFANKTMKIKFYKNGKFEVFIDDVLFYTDNNIGLLIDNATNFYIGSSANSFYNVYVKGLRVYYD